jgi:hypothetical protein
MRPQLGVHLIRQFESPEALQRKAVREVDNSMLKRIIKLGDRPLPKYILRCIQEWILAKPDAAIRSKLP